MRGMYRGLGPMLLGYIPTWAVYMTVYDWSKDFYGPRMGRRLLHMALSSKLIICSREHMAISNISLSHCRCMFDPCH